MHCIFYFCQNSKILEVENYFLEDGLSLILGKITNLGVVQMFGRVKNFLQDELLTDDIIPLG